MSATEASVPETSAPAVRRPGRSTARLMVLSLLAAGCLALLAMAVGTSGFVSLDNLKAIATSAALVGILASGMTYIVLSGNLFSLSLGTTAAICSLVFVWLPSKTQDRGARSEPGTL